MRVGVLGTMVWDRIHARDMRSGPVEEWGGITYALAGMSAAAPADWEIVPILRVGDDLRDKALGFLHSLPNLDLEQGVRFVPEPNNRVELRYEDAQRRLERLTGGVGPWAWTELEPALEGLDALYVNFISGFEMTLETAQRMRMKLHAPIYADLHSLLMGLGPGGLRTPQPLPAWRDWLGCFDVVQVNEDELALLARAWGDPWTFASDVVGHMPRLLLVTLGPRGAAYVASPMFEPRPTTWREPSLALNRPLTVTGPARTERVTAPEPVLDQADPTGCGDVFGATAFTRLLVGDTLEEAVRCANGAAGRNVRHRGATRLYDFLKGRIAT